MPVALKFSKVDPARRFFPWIGAVASALLLVLAFEPAAWWWCGWLALAPIWIAMRGSPRLKRNPLRYGYGLGLIFVLGSFWWVGAVTMAGIVIMEIILSCYFALWCLIMARVAALPENGGAISWRSLFERVVFGASLWVTLEWLRSWVMSGFNWNELGVSQVPSAPLRQLAALGGVPMITFVLVAFGLLIGEALWSAFNRRWKNALFATIAGAALPAASWCYGWHHLESHRDDLASASVSYACIQPDIAELPYAAGDRKEILRLEVDALTLQQDLSARAIAGDPDLLIWPESITTQRLEGGNLIDQVVDHIGAYYHGSFLLGSEEFDHGKLYNTAYLVAPDHWRSSMQRYRKVYLVILGEYLPWTDVFPWLRQWWGRGIFASAGTEPGHLVLERQNLSLAPLMCFEDTQPQVVNAAAARRPDFFVTLINAGWFPGRLATWCLKQHLENARLRCVEHDRPMIRCADTGISCEIDATGGVIAQLPERPSDPLETRGILQGRLYLHPWSPTLYEWWGDWVGWASRCYVAVLCSLFLVREYRRRT